MKTIALSLIGLSLIVCTAFFSFVPNLGKTCLVIGGNHTLHEGQSVEGKMVVIFAQVVVDPGARLDDGLVAISSDVSVDGAINGGVYALESDVNLSDQAKLTGGFRQIAPIDVVVLLPGIYTTATLGE